MFAKFAYAARDVRRVEMDVEPALAGLHLGSVVARVRRPRRNTRGVQAGLRLRQTLRVLAAVGRHADGRHDRLPRDAARILVPGLLSRGRDRRRSPDSTRSRPRTAPGSVSMVLVVCGLTIIAYAGAVIVESIAGGVFTGVLAERRRERTIERLRDHFIICGYGRVGRRVAEEFRAAKRPVRRARLQGGGGRSREGARRPPDRGRRDRGRGSEARRHRPRGAAVVVASDDDADNLYISLSARNVRPDIQIVARASDEDAEKKLLLAGADRVVMPYTAAGRTMANLVLKPQVMSFLDAVTTATGPDLHMAEIEVDPTCANAGKTIRDHPRAPRDRRDHRRAAQARRHVRHDARTGRGDRAGRRDRRRRHDRRAAAPRGPVRPAARARCRLIPSARSRRASVAGVELERPSDAEHGDYATNAALRLAGARRQAPRELAAELVEAAQALPEVERAEIAGPGLRQPLPRRRLVRRRAARDPRRGRGVRRRLGRAAASGCRSRWCRRTRPGRSRSRTRGTARTATPSRACSSSAGTTSRASTTTTTPARRWTASAPRSKPRGAARSRRRTATTATTSRSSRSSRAIRSRRCCAASRRRSSASASTSTRGRGRACSRSGCPSCCRGSTPTRRTARCGRARRRTATRRTACSSAPREARRPTAPPTSPYLVDKLERGFDRAIYVLGADHHGTRNWYAAIARMLGYDPSRVEVLLYQLVHLTEGGEQTKMSKRRGDVVFLDEFMDEIGVDAARWYLVKSGPDQTIEIDVDLAAEKSQKNPVYYVQYAHARIAGIIRNAGDATVSRRAHGAARAGGARADQAARRVPGGRRRRGGEARAAGDPAVRDPRRRRLPPLLPRAPRARERPAGVPARALPRDADRDRALSRPRRGRGARAHVRLRRWPTGCCSPRKERIRLLLAEVRGRGRAGARRRDRRACARRRSGGLGDRDLRRAHRARRRDAARAPSAAPSIGGLVVAGLLIAFQIVVAWFFTHPILPGS